MDEPEKSPTSEMTAALARLRGGEEGAAEAILGMVYQELRRLAKGYVHKHGHGQTLHTQATSLVHEAYLRLFDHERTQVGDRAHFMAQAARAMRSFLVDQARSRQRAKRGGGWKRISDFLPTREWGCLPRFVTPSTTATSAARNWVSR